MEYKNGIIYPLHRIERVVYSGIQEAGKEWELGTEEVRTKKGTWPFRRTVSVESKQIVLYFGDKWALRKDMFIDDGKIYHNAKIIFNVSGETYVHNYAKTEVDKYEETLRQLEDSLPSFIQMFHSNSKP